MRALTGHQSSLMIVLKGIESPHGYFFRRSLKLNQYFLHMRRRFLNFMVTLLNKIVNTLNTKILLASMKTLSNYETCTESRHPIFVIGRFSPVITSHWTAEKQAYIYMYIVQCLGRLTEQFSESQSGSGARFTVSECRNKLFEEGYWKNCKNF
jgi:hypothetical protein